MGDVTLQPMTELEFGEFMDLIVPAYVMERAMADQIPREVAERDAREQHSKLLPEGRQTAGHHFYRIVSAETGQWLGGVWFHVNESANHAYLYNITALPGFRRP